MTPLIERMLKTARLAREGVGGEKGNAEVILQKLLKAHGLTMADLDEIAQPTRAWLWLRGRDEAEFTVLVGIYLSICGREVEIFERSNTAGWCGAEVTAAQSAAIRVSWDVYKPAWREAQRELALAFAMKHRLCPEPRPADEKDDEPTTAANRDAALRRAQMAMGLAHVERPTKRLASGAP